MKRLSLLLMLVMLVLAPASQVFLPTSAYAMPTPAMSVTGTLLVNGAASPAGVLIRAGTSSQIFSTAVTNSSGKFGISSPFNVPGDDSDTTGVEGATENQEIGVFVGPTQVSTIVYKQGTSKSVTVSITDTSNPSIAINAVSTPTTNSTQTITGTFVDAYLRQITVNGVSASINMDAGTWSVIIPLSMGSNSITAIAFDAANRQGQASSSITRQAPGTTTPSAGAAAGEDADSIASDIEQGTAAEAIEAVDALDSDQAIEVVDLLETSTASAVIEGLSTAKGVTILEGISASKAVAILQNLSTSKAVDILQNISLTKAVSLLQELTSAKAVAIIQDISVSRAVSIIQDIATAKAVAIIQGVSTAKAVSVIDAISNIKAVAIVEDITTAKAVAIIEDITIAKSISIIRDVSVAKAVEIVDDLSLDRAVAILDGIPSDKGISIVQDISTEKAVDIVENITTTKAADIIVGLTINKSTEIVESISITKAGSIMEAATIAGAAQIMQSVTLTTRTNLVVQMSEDSLIERLPEMNIPALFEIPSLTLFDNLPKVQSEHLIAEVAPVTDDSLAPLEDLSENGITIYGVDDIDIVPAWIDLSNTPLPLKNILGKFNASLKDVRISMELLGELPAEMPILEGNQILHSAFKIGLENANEDDLLAAHIEFAIPKSWIQDNNIHEWSVLVSRFDESNGSWESYPTKRTQETETEVIYTVVLPGFSYVAITASQDLPTIPYKVSDLVVFPSSPLIGQTITVQATVTNLTNQEIKFPGSLWVNNTAELSKSQSIPAKETQTISFYVTKPTPGVLQLRADRLTAQVEVLAETPEVGDTSMQTSSVIGLFFAGLATIILGLYLLNKSRRHGAGSG